MPRWRRGRGKRREKGPGRPMKSRNIGFNPAIKNFVPAIPKGTTTNPEPIFLTLAELEVLRLVDMEGMMQEEAGTQMGVSRGTIWRLLQSAREKVARMLIEGRELNIVPET
jgi:predicted DNA-binding protein (UPF0251 family)